MYTTALAYNTRISLVERFQGKSSEEADKRSSVLEALRDVAVIEAMLSSSEMKGTPGVVEVGLDGSGTDSSAKQT